MSAMRTTINELLSDYKKVLHHDITVQGWVRAFRSNRFIALNDGSTINNLQVVVDFEKFDEHKDSIIALAEMAIRQELASKGGKYGSIDADPDYGGPTLVSDKHSEEDKDSKVKKIA